jgi:acetoin utilization protein AcuC
MARAPTLVWDERFLDYDFGPAHPFTERSRGLAVELLDLWLAAHPDAAIDRIDRVPTAPRADLESFHRADYLDFVEESGLREFASLLDAGDTPAFPGCYEAAARIVGGALGAMRSVLEGNAPAFHPAGGLHHAHPARASGFCIFNDLAVAIAAALRDRRRVAYVDIDAHHGDGVMYGYYESARVLAIDFHQDGRTLFPGTGTPEETGRGDGAGTKVNLPLPPLAGDEALLPLFRRVAVPMLTEFAPDVIVLQHGLDGHVGDPLARLQYSPAAYAEIARTVRALAEERCGGRLLVTGGGGYRPSSVTRGLATAGAIALGAPVPEATDELPDAWRHRFRAMFDTPAPRHWRDPETFAPSPWRPDDAEHLVELLERALGRRFPAPAD